MLRWGVKYQLYVQLLLSDIVSQLIIKDMMYTRASASDYDDWEFRYDNPGWGSKHLIPLIKKVPFLHSNLHKYLG